MEKRVALVDGGSRGYSNVVALRFAAEGAKVAITARTLDSHPPVAGSTSRPAPPAMDALRIKRREDR